MRLPLLVLIFPALLHGATWHVSSAHGNDANAGTLAAPLRTLAQALERSSGGDTVLLSRGGEFREPEHSVGGGRILAAYGDPRLPLPIISGSNLLTGWTPLPGSPGVWQANLPSQSVTNEILVFAEGLLLTQARHPNTGWLRVESGTDSNRIVSNALKSIPGNRSGRWVGAQVRWRKWSWWYETRPVSADDGAGRLSLGGASFSTSRTGIGSGYYLDRHREALDVPGEWFWDQGTGKLLLIPPGGVDPNGLRIEVALRRRAFTLNGATLRELHLRHHTAQGVEISRPSVIEDCLIELNGGIGIGGGFDAGGTQVRRNVIRDVYNTGISWNENIDGAGGTIIEHNVIERCGIIPGLGASGSWRCAGYIVYNSPFGEKGVQFRYNRIDRTGYAGVILGEPGQTVERNLIRNAMLTLNDGAGIYCNASYNFIRDNIILDTRGDLDSSHPWLSLSHGIWVEYLSNFHSSIITGNTVVGAGGNGLYLPNNFTCTVSNNTFLSNHRSGMYLGRHEPGRSDDRPNQEHVITGNLVGLGAVPWAPLPGFRNENPETPTNDVCLMFHVHDDRDLDFGTMTGTTFLTTDGRDHIATSAGQKPSIATWQQQESTWADPAPRVVQGEGYLLVNDTLRDVAFLLPFGSAWMDLDGAPLDGAVSLAPFTSRVVLAQAKVPGLPVALLYSEQPGNVDLLPWAKQRGLAGVLALPSADPDGDGLPNAVEYLLGSDPDHGDAARLAALARPVEGGWELDLRRHQDGWTLRAETSSELGNWLSAPLESAPGEPAPGFKRHRVATPSEVHAFLRLAATPTP